MMKDSTEKEELVIALDIGSSSIRCIPYKTDGESIVAINECSSSYKRASIQPNTGKIVLFDMDDIHNTIIDNDSQSVGKRSIFDDIDKCIDETLGLLRSHYNQVSIPFHIIGIGISSFVMNLIGINVRGEILGEKMTLSYACNSNEVVVECSKLKNELGEDRIHNMYQRVGTPIHNAYAIGQLRHLESLNEEVNVHKWTTISSYCIQRWTGNDFINIPISYSEASWTGLFNFHTCTWDEECMKLIPNRFQKSLPIVSDYNTEQYAIQEYIGSDGCQKRNPYWTRWPELRGSGESDKNYCCKIFLGFGDGIGANIGSKCSTPQRIACTIGTSAAVRLCLPYNKLTTAQGKNSDQVISIPFGLFCYRIDSQRVLLGGALTDGGSIIEFCRKLLNLDSNEKFMACLTEAACSYTKNIENNDSNSELNVVPFLSGERSTGFRGGATGCISGLTLNTTSSDLLRSCLGSVILRLNKIMKLIESNNPTIYKEAKCIVASGNALEKNSLWRQMLSDCTGHKVVIDSDANEGTSRGIAILISQSLRAIGPYEEKLVVKKEETPNQEAKKFWTKQTEYQETLISFLSPMWK